MREYLYVDHERLESYVQQIAGPVVYDKVPELSVELSLVGPKAGSSQKRAARARTTHESLVLFETHLEKKGNLEVGPPRAMGPNHADFFRESFEAFSGVLGSGDVSLKLWLNSDSTDADPDNRCGGGRDVILIQDYRANHGGPQTISGYSGLSLLASELDWLSGTPLEDFSRDLRKQKYFEGSLNQRPFSTLKKLGVKFGPARAITSIYRFRASCISPAADSKAVPTVIAYPIAIWET